MIGNNVLTLHLQPSGAPEADFVEEHFYAVNDAATTRKIFDAVKRGKSVAVELDSVNRIVVSLEDFRGQSLITLWGFRGVHTLNVRHTDEARFAAHLSGFIGNNQRAVRA